MAHFKTFRVEADGRGVVSADVNGIAGTTAALNDLRADSPGNGVEDPRHHFLPPYVSEAARPTFPRQEGGQ